MSDTLKGGDKPSGNHTGDDRKGTIDYASKCKEVMSKPCLCKMCGISSEDTCLLSERHPV